MAYITMYTLGKLAREIESNIEITKEVFLTSVYNDEEIFNILNKNEKRYLFNYVHLLQDEERFKIQYFQDVPVRADSKKLVFDKGGKSKFHLKNDCALLYSNYVDFFIPKEIGDLGDSAVEDYREWFRRNDYAKKIIDGKITEDVIVATYNLVFPKKYGLQPLRNNSQNFLFIKRLNGGNSFIQDSINIKELQIELLKLKDGFYQIFSCKVTRILSKYSSLNSKHDQEIIDVLSDVFSPEFVKNYGIKNVREKFQWSLTIKNKMIQLLLNFFKWQYKVRDKSFEIKTLEYFGLECCRHCKEVENFVAIDTLLD